MINIASVIFCVCCYGSHSWHPAGAAPAPFSWTGWGGGERIRNDITTKKKISSLAICRLFSLSHATPLAHTQPPRRTLRLPPTPHRSPAAFGFFSHCLISVRNPHRNYSVSPLHPFLLCSWPHQAWNRRNYSSPFFALGTWGFFCSPFFSLASPWLPAAFPCLPSPLRVSFDPSPFVSTRRLPSTVLNRP